MSDGFLLVRITAPHFCAGLRLMRAGNACAPILAYMREWPLPRIREYCLGKGWTVELVDLREPVGLPPIDRTTIYAPPVDRDTPEVKP